MLISVNNIEVTMLLHTPTLHMISFLLLCQLCTFITNVIHVSTPLPTYWSTFYQHFHLVFIVDINVKSKVSLISVLHYGDVIMGAIASQITCVTTVYPTVYSSAGQRKHQSSASLALVRGIHRWPVNSPHKGPVTRKIFPFDDVIMDKGTF